MHLPLPAAARTLGFLAVLWALPFEPALAQSQNQGQAQCRARSGPQRLPVVELYTSEGCSSCPPADRQLAELARASSPALVPLAWHVDFWDHLGWRDPYAQASFTQRQRQLVQANGQRTVYTPHVFVSGREVRDRQQVGKVVQAAGTAAPRWQIDLEALPQSDRQWSLAAQATPTAPVDGHRPVDVVLVVTEDGLGSKVTAGENAGERLRHAHVVRHWWVSGPQATPTPSVQASVSLAREQSHKGLDLVAFVQDRRTLEILQAVRLPGCLRG